MVDLTQHEGLVVRQLVESLEVFTGFETRNKYAILTPEGTEILYAYEASGFVSRQFLATHRPLTFHVIDEQKQPLMTVQRGFFWLLSHTYVEDKDQQPIGALHRRFVLLGRRYAVEDATGNEIASLKGPLLHPNTFTFYQNEQEVARITKEWGGIMREGFTRADTFDVRFTPGAGDQHFRMLVLAAALCIDMDFFENRSRNNRGGGGGGFSFGAGGNR